MGFLDRFTNLYHDDGELDLVDEEAWFAERAPQLPAHVDDDKYDDELDQYLVESEEEFDASVNEEGAEDDNLGDLLLAELEREDDEDAAEGDLDALLLAELEGDVQQDLSQRYLLAGEARSVSTSSTQRPSSKSGSLKRKAEHELDASEKDDTEVHKGRKIKALKKSPRMPAGTPITSSAEAPPQFDLDGLFANGNLSLSEHASKPDAIDPLLHNGSYNPTCSKPAPEAQQSKAPLPYQTPEDTGLDRLSDAGMAQAVRSSSFERQYSNEEKRAFLRRKTGQSLYKLKKEDLEAEIRKWYHHSYEPYLAANRPYEERKAKRRAKLAARKASGNYQSTLNVDGKTVIVLDDDDDDDDSAPPALSEEEHERVRQALRGSFGKNGKHSSRFSNAPAAGRASQASHPIGISITDASIPVASKPKQRRKKKDVVKVDAITDEGERAELQRAQMAMYQDARANLNGQNGSYA